MSVYFIRHQHLVKIGFSSNLGQRAGQIMREINGPAEFVGHMPGDRDMEAHLHRVFSEHRFAGEWFVESDAMRSFASLVLIPELPAPSDPMVAFTRRAEANDAALDMRDRLRRLAAHMWPEANHLDRKCELQKALGWTKRRVRSLYEGEITANVRQVEADQVAELESEMAAYRQAVHSGRGEDVASEIQGGK